MTNTGGTAPGLDEADLDDHARLLAADHRGVLRGVASAGALVRATEAAVADGVLDRLQDRTVRSVAMVASHGSARRAAELVQALVGQDVGVPVVSAASIPRWVGSLDVVVVATDDPGDVRLSESVSTALSRGAEVVLLAPEEGLLTPAAAGRALLLPPRVRVPEGMDLLRFVAAGLAVLGALQATRPPNLGALADELDAEAERNQASRATFSNPAKTLALRCSGRQLVIAADSAVLGVVAAHLASALLGHAAVVAAAVELSQALLADARPPALDPLFYDPDIDGPLETTPLRVLVLSTAPELAQLRRNSAALPDAELVSATADSGSTQQDPTAEVLRLAVRCETAAVYVGLATRSAASTRR